MIVDKEIRKVVDFAYQAIIIEQICKYRKEWPTKTFWDVNEFNFILGS